MVSSGLRKLENQVTILFCTLICLFFPCQINFLKSVPLLSELPHTVLTKLGDVLESEQFSTGDYIIREGTVGDTFYILASGKDSLYIGKDPEL